MKRGLIFCVFAVVTVFSDGVGGDKGYRAELKLLGSNKVFALLSMSKWIRLLTVGSSSKETFECPEIIDMRKFLLEELLFDEATVIIYMIPILIEVLRIDIHIHPLKSDFPYHRDDKGNGEYGY